MTPQRLYDLFRLDVDDKTQPFLWSDEEVFEYLNDAQDMFCRLAYGIPDASTPKVVEVAIASGDQWSSLHPSILQIRRAELNSTGRKLSVVNFEDLDTLGSISDDYGWPRHTNWSSLITQDPGPIDYMIIGMEDNRARWVRVPMEDDRVNLIVYRRPLCRFDIDKIPTEFEIDEIHHIHLLKWMRSLAYAKQDPDTFNPKFASENQVQFEYYCRQARSDWERKRHKPRSMAYGGI